MLEVYFAGGCHVERNGRLQTKDWFDPCLASLITRIKACSQIKDLETGKRLHSEAANTGLLPNRYVANTFISMYSKCGDMSEARSVFDSLTEQTLVSRTTLLQGYVENGKAEVALRLFEEMKQGDCHFVPDSRTYAVVISACAALAGEEKEENVVESRMNRWLEKGKQVHSQAVANRCCDSFVKITLVDMYAKLGNMLEAQAVFDGMPVHDVVAWTALIQGYVDNAQGSAALEVFERMEKSCTPNARTYVAVVAACAYLAAENVDVTGPSGKWLEKGRLFHSKAVTSNCSNYYVESALVNMYSKCGSMEEARRVFNSMERPGVIPWTALLQGYVENGESEKALELFERSSGTTCVANVRTYVILLTACASLGSKAEDASLWLQKGKAIHSQALRNRCCNVFVETSLVNMYAKCGSMSCARELFDKMVHRNVVTWNGLINGYVENGDNELALEVLTHMYAEPDAVTFIAGLMACGNIMAAARGEELHLEIQKLGLEKDVMVSTCLVDFYGKCGNMEAARKVFDSMTRKGVVTWNNLISGYSLQGDAHHACELLHKMKEQGVQPDEVTFVCVLSACSHAGMTDEGRKYFNMLSSEYGMEPSIKHYTCLVDLLGRANYLEEALRVLRTMPHEPDAAIWCTLLAACRKKHNVAVGKVAYESLMKLDEKHGAAYSLMASIYGSAEEGVRAPARGLQSQTLWTDTGGKVYSFVSNNENKTMYS